MHRLQRYASCICPVASVIGSGSALLPELIAEATIGTAWNLHLASGSI